MKIVRIAAAMALMCAHAFATTPKPLPAQPTMQQQIEDLKQQVAALQLQVQHLKSGPKAQQVCISLWCA